MKPGTYAERVFLDGPVEIRGQGSAAKVVIAAPDGPAVVISGETTVTIRSMTVRSVAADVGEAHGIVVRSGALVLEECVVGSASGAGITLEGPMASAVLKGCTVTDCRKWGAVAVDKARLTATKSSFSGGEQSGIQAGAGAVVDLKECVLQGPGRYGLYVAAGATATAEKCEFKGCALVGAFVEGEGAAAAFKDCAFTGSKGCGVQAAWKGIATVEGGSATANAFNGVEAKAGGRAVLRSVVLADNGRVGLVLYEKGEASAAGCEMRGNAMTGFEAREDSTFEVKDCRMKDNRQSGVSVHHGAKGLLEKCAVSGSSRSGLYIGEGGEPRVRDCKVTGSGEYGVWAVKGAKGSVEGCDLRGNKFGGYQADPGSSTTAGKNREK